MADGPEVQASGGQIFFALISALWLIVAGLLLSFIAALGTLACGAICGTLIPVGMVAGLVAMGGFVLAFRLIFGVFRRRLSSGLMRLSMMANFGFLVALVGLLVVMGAE